MADAGDAGGRASVTDDMDDEAAAVDLGTSTVPMSSSSSCSDAGSLSTLAMIILSYNKNDARLAIDNVRQGRPLLADVCAHTYLTHEGRLATYNASHSKINQCCVVQRTKYTQTDRQADGHPFNGLFSRTTWVHRHQKGKTNLDFNEARDDGGNSGISWTMYKSFVHCFRQIATPPPHHSNF